jgi:hypothetical protein
MRLWTLPLRLIGILALAALVSGAWLFRRELAGMIGPQVGRLTDALGAGAGAALPDSGASARARDKVDSMHGWSTDSVVLTPGEMAALLAEALPPTVREHLDSVGVVLGNGRLRVSARLETRLIPAEVLGPLAGAVQPWEAVAVDGPLVAIGRGRAEWRTETLSLRGFVLPSAASRALLERALPGVHDGVVPLTLPKGVGGLRVRPGGVTLYSSERRWATGS